MDPALALPARRISDLLSSGLQARVKSKREAMDQPRTDPDQELVKRTQAGEASAFDDLVVKYTPRLYGLVYNMTSNHEDTNDLLQDIFAKAYKAIRGFRGKSSFYTWVHSIAVNMTQFPQETRPPVSTEPGRRGREHSKRQGIHGSHGDQQPGARSGPLRATAKIERGHDEIV